MTQIINGNSLACEIRKNISYKINEFKKKGHRVPHLALILIGEDPASQIYIQNKIKDCQNVGFYFSLKKLPYDISINKILNLIQKLNNNNIIDGIIIQLPLPDHIDFQKIILSINPDKDVDGLHPINIGKMLLNIESFIPATPLGILTLFKKYSIKTQNKHTVIIGRSIIVGRPMSILMSRKSIFGNSTVTIAHSFTLNIIKFTRQADIIITALGVPKFLKSYMIKKNTVIIDVGITRIKDNLSPKGYRLVGDVDFESVYDKSSYITPVPGGIGPLTRAMLLKNTLLAYKKKI